MRVSRPAPGVQIELGSRVRLYDYVGLYLDGPQAVVAIGHRTYVNRRTEITCRRSVRIGQDCAISWDVLITDTDYHSLNEQSADAAVSIGDHVWIGARAAVLKGVTIGDGAVTAAGALVTSDVPAGCVAAGVPARVIREQVTWA